MGKKRQGKRNSCQNSVDNLDTVQRGAKAARMLAFQIVTNLQGKMRIRFRELDKMQRCFNTRESKQNFQFGGGEKFRNSEQSH